MDSNEISASNAGTITFGDITVNRLGFGAMRITGPGVWGEPADPQNAKQVLQKAVELGVNFIDTADAYGPEVSERLIHEALHPYKGLLIATKGGLTRTGPGEWVPDCRPEHLRQACEESLQRLGVDQVDLYQLHTVDVNVPFETSFQTLLDLQSEGKIRYIGLSNIEPSHFEAAMQLGGGFVSVQNNYNILNREHEDVLRLCEQHNIAFIPYFPIGGNQTNGVADEVLKNIATRYEATERQIGLAWLLHHSKVMAPIPGTSSIDHLRENVAAASIQLDSDDMHALDNIANV